VNQRRPRLPQALRELEAEVRPTRDDAPTSVSMDGPFLQPCFVPAPNNHMFASHLLAKGRRPQQPSRARRSRLTTSIHPLHRRHPQRRKEIWVDPRYPLGQMVNQQTLNGSIGAPCTREWFNGSITVCSKVQPRPSLNVLSTCREWDR
jgi:hypothetical protein